MNEGNPEKILDYAEKVAWYDERIRTQIDAYESLGGLLADVEKRVRVTTLEYLHANPESKKISFEKAEALAAVSDQQRCDYYEAVFLRQKAKIAEHIMTATQAGLSGLQSLMKYSVPTGGRF